MQTNISIQSLSFFLLIVGVLTCHVSAQEKCYVPFVADGVTRLYYGTESPLNLERIKLIDSIVVNEKNDHVIYFTNDNMNDNRVASWYLSTNDGVLYSGTEFYEEDNQLYKFCAEPGERWNVLGGPREYVGREMRLLFGEWKEMRRYLLYFELPNFPDSLIPIAYHLVDEEYGTVTTIDYESGYEYLRLIAADANGQHYGVVVTSVDEDVQQHRMRMMYHSTFIETVRELSQSGHVLRVDVFDYTGRVYCSSHSIQELESDLALVPNNSALLYRVIYSDRQVLSGTIILR